MEIIDSTMRRTQRDIQVQGAALEKMETTLERMENMFFNQAKALHPRDKSFVALGRFTYSAAE